jgi:hypothetical protein
VSSKFLTYWSLAFAVFFIWIMSILVALGDVKDELLEKIRKQGAARGKARLRPANPLAGLSVAETLTSPARTEAQEWVYGEVARIAQSLNLNVKIVVLQDSMDHFLVHFAQGPRLVTYRVDKAWVADARAGKADQLERIRRAVEQYLRVEFLGEKPAPPPAAATPAAAAARPASTPAAAGAAAAPSPGPPASGASAAAPGPGAAPAAGATPATGAATAGPATGTAGEMTREERIAAARAKAEAIKAQRESGKPPEGGPLPSGS